MSNHRRPDTTPGFTPEEYRAVMGRFVTGVTVVTVVAQDGPHGTTVNAFASLSLNPPLVLVCLRREAFSAQAIVDAGTFGVSILGHGQGSVGQHFASASRPPGVAGFAGIPHVAGSTGVPLLGGAVAHIECTLAGQFPAGDHTVFVGEVIGLAAADDIEPLAFHRGRFLTVA